MMHSAGYKNNFNLIRLIAALQVFAVHSLNHFGVSGFFTDFLKATPGVPIFFFVSGYLIGTTYKNNYHQGIGRFFRNRFLRIYPGLVICVLLSTMAVAFTGYFHSKDVGIFHFVIWIMGQISVFQFYNPDFMRLFGVGVLNGALWTITVEIQFYLLVPLIHFLINRRPGWLMLVFILSLVLNLFLRSHADFRSIPLKLLAVSFMPWVYMFLCGFVIAHREELKVRIERIGFPYLLLAYVASMNFVGGYIENAQNSINPVSFMLLAGLIFKIANTPLPLPKNILAHIQRSDYSYGFYLYHMPVINILLFLGLFPAGINVAIAAVISSLAAFMSWKFIEKPALELKRK